MKALHQFIGRCFATPRRTLISILIIIALWGALNPNNASYIIASLWYGFWKAFGPIFAVLIQLAFVCGICCFIWTKVLFKKAPPSGGKKKK